MQVISLALSLALRVVPVPGFSCSSCDHYVWRCIFFALLGSRVSASSFIWFSLKAVVIWPSAGGKPTCYKCGLMIYFHIVSWDFKDCQEQFCLYSFTSHTDLLECVAPLGIYSVLVNILWIIGGKRSWTPCFKVWLDIPERYMDVFVYTCIDMCIIYHNY